MAIVVGRLEEWDAEIIFLPWPLPEQKGEEPMPYLRMSDIRVGGIYRAKQVRRQANRINDRKVLAIGGDTVIYEGYYANKETPSRQRTSLAKFAAWAEYEVDYEPVDRG